MVAIDRATSGLLLIVFQQRLMPAIADGAAVIAEARRLLDAAALLGVPVQLTEQYVRGLGPTVPALEGAPVRHEMTFDATRAGPLLPDRAALVVAGCEAHVCVLQTVLSLVAQGRAVFVVRDATGARRAERKDAALARMAAAGAQIVTAEMAIFEWLGTAEHPRFREAIALVK